MPPAHLPNFSTRTGLGTILRSSGTVRFVQGGVVKTFRWVPQVSSYTDDQRETMDAYHAGLYDQPNLIVTLSNDIATAVLAYLLGLACESTNFANIMYGRNTIAAMPHDWVVPRIHNVAVRELNLTDDWECRRLLELYNEIDETLMQRFASVCSESPDPHIAEAGRDFLDAGR